MTTKYRLRRFAVGKGTFLGKDNIKGRERLIYMGPKGGMYYIGTNSLTTSRKKRLIVQYYRVYIQPDSVVKEE